MGIKFLSLQMIPWCFHLMGTHMSCLHLRPDREPDPPVAGGTIKLIKSDGVVKTYDRPVLVSDLMSEFPKHLVCRSDSFYIGRKIPSLSEHDRLQIGQKYFLLPNHFFQSVLSFVTVASFAATAAAAKRSAAAARKAPAACQPFDIQKTPSGCLRIRVSDEFIAQLMEEEEEEEHGGVAGRVCTTAQLQRDYTLLVGSRQWKPKLETIKESEKKKRRRFGASFKRKKTTQKAQCHNNQRSSSSSSSSSSLAHEVSGVKGCSKSKIKGKSRK